MRGAAFAAALLLAIGAASADPVSITVVKATVSREVGITAGMTLVLSPESAALFAALTTANVGRVMVLRVDGATLMAPVIRDPILGGEVRIAGNFTREQMTVLAERIASGAAKVEVEIRAP